MGLGSRISVRTGFKIFLALGIVLLRQRSGDRGKVFLQRQSAFLVSCLILTAVIFLPGPGFCSEDKVLYTGVIQTYRLNLRQKPNRRALVLLVMKKGDQVDVVGKQGGDGGWLVVIFRGEKGYIRNRPKYIRLTPVTRPKKDPVPESPEAAPETESAGLEPEAAVPGKIREEKEAVVSRIATEEEKVDAISQEEMEIIEGLDQIDRALNRSRINADQLSAEIRNLAEQMTQTADSLERLTGQLEQSRAYAGQRLNALYRLGMIGRFDMTDISGSLFDFFVKQNAMKRMVRSDFQILEDQTRTLAALEKAREDMARQTEAKAKKEKDLRLQIRIKEKETEKKQAILGEIRRKKQLSLAALASLKESARALDEKMAGFLSTEMARMASAAFPDQKGRLPIPAKGEIISRFGPSKTGDYKAFTFQKGIDIRVERGEPVRSVFRGEVMFAEWLKGYGNLLIINHGDNYYTLYAHVEEVFKKRGERVDAGEVIATAGDTGSIKGLCLHFEIRHHGKPVNPMKWLRKGA
ncbi:peptidoglycan DD-metalloendopeptidase family protein [Desulfospira joergensenii]|uniref:peptidoglycan DD-metalloendopeptidase family protein n=1 Tax=Desulfospira joergensenii TaxID=53329 RepID=UPI0003B2E311|nr:peptidoglycan DD-metalloendopeptidase family protein [Desulfospira joergensenii]